MPSSENATPPGPAPRPEEPPLFTRPPVVVMITSALLLLFALLAPADPGFRAITAFAAILLLLLVRDRPKPDATSEQDAPPPPARLFPPTPSGTSRVDVTHPGPTPDDVAWVWRQFRALEPGEQRTPETFAQALNDAAASGATIVAAEGISARAANDLASALRRAGAEVEVREIA